ncbi:MAG: MFS transporter [Elusimicrobiota bacterium]|nr:MAG: MFS transporter [Elusimicrobiota bacterium]
MRRSLETAALGLSGLGLGLAAAAPSAAGARLELSTAHAAVLIGAGLWARALSSAFAGALVDRFGGRRGLAVAAAGAGACGLAFAALASRERGAFAALVLLNAASGYFVSFAGPSAARLNSDAAEAARGRLAGLYAALAFPAALLVLAPGGPWLESHAGRWLAALPAAAAALAFAASRFAPAEPAAKEERASLKELPATARDPRVLALAGLEACAGAARWGLLAWAAPFLAEAHHVRPGDPAYGTALASVAAGALAGP